MTDHGSDSGGGIGRRTFLKVTGGAGAAGLFAGCTGGGGEEVRTVIRTVEGEERTVVRTVKVTEEQEFPSENLLFIVPYSTGGGYNYYTRLVAKYINQNGYLPEAVRVQNVTGGGGVVGHNRIYNEDPDGHTAGIINPDSMAKAQIVRDEARFDLSEYTFYPRIAGRVPAIAVGDHVDVNSGQEFIDAMANGDLTVGHSGVTSTGSFTPMAVGLASGAYDENVILDNDVQFPGKSEWLTAIKREEVDVMSASYSSLLPFVESGDINVVLVLTKDEDPPDATPDADTLADTPSVDADQAIGLAGGTYHRVFVAPPDVPSARAKVVRQAIRKAIQNENLQAEAEENGRPISFLNSQDTKNGVIATLETWQENEELLRSLLDQA